MKETDINKWATLMIEKMKEVHSSNWTKPWFTSRFKGFPQNLTGRSYNNQNKVVLYFICDKYKYKTPIFVTFNQARNERITSSERCQGISYILLRLNH